MLDRQSGKNVIKKDFGKPFAEEKSVKGKVRASSKRNSRT
jgi:hypothetical protein